MNVDKKKLWIQILAFIGLGLTIELAFIYYSANFDKYALSSFCSVNEFIDCDGAARSTAAQFLGIPLAYWGMFFYLIVLFLTFVNKLQETPHLGFLRVFKNPKAYIATLGSIAFICSMILAVISLVGIKKLCILCVVTYFIDLIIATIAADGLFKNIITGFKTTFFDFIDGVKTYPKTFVGLLLNFSSFLTYSAVSLNFVKHLKTTKEFRKYRKMKENPYRVKGNVLGNEKGEVIIELYSDFVCPLCYIHNIMLHQAAQEYKNIKVIHHNYPLDMDCNEYISFNVHPKACFMSKAALAAEKQGNYWEMSSLLYEKQPTSKKQLRKLVEQLNFDMEKFAKDFDSAEIKKEINEEIVYAAEELEIDATPTMFINKKKYVGIKPYFELKKILEEHGAKRD